MQWPRPRAIEGSRQQGGRHFTFASPWPSHGLAYMSSKAVTIHRRSRPSPKPLWRGFQGGRDPAHATSSRSQTIATHTCSEDASRLGASGSHTQCALDACEGDRADRHGLYTWYAVRALGRAGCWSECPESVGCWSRPDGSADCWSECRASAQVRIDRQVVHLRHLRPARGSEIC